MRLIDADAIVYNDKLFDSKGDLVVAYETIDAALTVDVAPVVHGHWVMRGGKRYCSSCEKRACVTRDSEDFWYTVGTDFYPNCGADMRK